MSEPQADRVLEEVIFSYAGTQAIHAFRRNHLHPDVIPGVLVGMLYSPQSVCLDVDVNPDDTIIGSSRDLTWDHICPRCRKWCDAMVPRVTFGTGMVVTEETLKHLSKLSK